MAHGALIESSRAVKPWREAVKYAALAGGRRVDLAFPLDRPVRAVVVFTLRKPASAPKRRRTWPDRYPDLSKLLRSTEDALVDAGVLRDDARIVEYARAAKVFPGEDDDALDSPGCVIRLYRMEDA